MKTQLTLRLLLWAVVGVTVRSAFFVVASADSVPVIATQPQSLTVTNGDPASFTVEADGSPPPTYQWRENSLDIAGATGAVYNITVATTNNGGGYTVVVSNPGGSVTSAPPANLTVLVPPTISRQPQNLTATNGSTASFSVVARGSPAPTYQWRKNGTNVAGATAAAYSIADVTTNNAGGYSVLVANAAGSVTSSVATLTVVTTAMLVGWSDMGIRETDGSDVSVYSIAPPYSTLYAQLMTGGRLVTNDNGFKVTYEAVADSAGSINTTSQGKGNFYEFVQKLYGVALSPDQGIAGFGMPGPTNQPQVMTYDSTQHCYSAVGIPLTPYDDQGRKNYYPLMRLIARDGASNVLASTDVVLPVTDEMDCRACHGSGTQTAARPNAGWAWDLNPEKDYKLNVLRNHDDHHLGSVVYSNVLSQVGYNTAGLVATVTRDGTPISCIRCHASNSLPETGAPEMRPLTQLMHTKHAFVTDPQTGSPLSYLSESTACMTCHAGPDSRRLRGVHHNLANADGTRVMQCQSCHGTFTELGRVGRQGWIDEPNCQSCHTGTATKNNGQLQYTSVIDEVTGLIRQSVDSTFATQTNAASSGLLLFRNARGHGGLKCEACHGSGHAELPSSQSNDNRQSQQLQGHTGTLTDCGVCHPAVPRASAGGPHGLHPVDSSWANNHDNGGRTQCQACHGASYLGTPLSAAQGARAFGGRSFWQGNQISCYNCHNGANGGDNGTGVAPATAGSGSAITLTDTPVNIPLQASGTPLAFRTVSPPAHGAVNVSGNAATYFPAAGFAGGDSFTFTANNGRVDSGLGTISLTVTPGDCVLTANALAPLAALPNVPVPFRAVASADPCAGTVVCEWDFGDGKPLVSGTNVSHVFPSAGDYTWTLTATANGVSQVISNIVTISSVLGPPLSLTMAQMDPYSVILSWPSDRIPVSLENSYDFSQPYSWQPMPDAPTLDGTNWTLQADMSPVQQFFRLRRVP